MTEANLVSALYNIIYYSALLLVPPLLMGTLVTFAIALFQTENHIREDTLPQTVKVLVTGLLLVVFGSLLAMPLFTASDEIFTRFHKFYSRSLP